MPAWHEKKQVQERKRPSDQMDRKTQIKAPGKRIALHSPDVGVDPALISGKNVNNAP